MKIAHFFSGMLALTAFSSLVMAVETPDDTYFVCGQFVIAMETGWKQRMENRFEDHSATIRTDFEELEPGKPANRLAPQMKGEAYPDRIELWTGAQSKIDRRTAILQRREHSAVKARQFPSGEYDPYVWRSYQCEIVSKRKLNDIIAEHNKPFGKLKF